ncbi:iron-sulfur cluster assembly scaffold protein [Candidatus Bathyarchaeota archaeon]|nr:iron-sulfur cluster assembly scaffold protein [Candidatus Bathyarchaeota archaeon]
MRGKTFYRCTVCNDIHYGNIAPKICPTCSSKDAYVHIAEREAGVILKFLKIEEGKIVDIKYKTHGCVATIASKDFTLNTDKERIELIVQGVLEHEEQYGLKYCPCRMTSGNFDEDLSLICPCNFKIQNNWKEIGECWCSLFIKRKE